MSWLPRHSELCLSCSDLTAGHFSKSLVPVIKHRVPNGDLDLSVPVTIQGCHCSSQLTEREHRCLLTVSTCTATVLPPHLHIKWNSFLCTDFLSPASMVSSLCYPIESYNKPVRSRLLFNNSLRQGLALQFFILWGPCCRHQPGYCPFWWKPRF